MKRSARSKFLTMMVIVIGAAAAGAERAKASPYYQTDLVSNITGLATITDPNLKNSWGVAHSATSPIWVSNQGTNTSTLYAVTGPTGTAVAKFSINPPSGFVAIPTTASGPQGPTGQVSNGNGTSFLVSNGDGKSAHFIFASLNGTISAWDTGTTAHIQATTSGAVYTGLAINQAQTQLYAANDAGTTGSIDVFSKSFAPVSLGAGAFATPTAIAAAGLVPFNVQDINGNVYVTYAPSGRTAQQNAALGSGAVVEFKEDGTFEKTLITGSHLAAPWGIALAPASFGQFHGDLLVGNFSYLHSEINAFNPTTGMFEGTIPITLPSPDTPGGLWAIYFGVGGNNGSPNTLYFADGINGETGGLIGALTPTPVPSTWGLTLLAFAGMGLLANRRGGSRTVLG